MEDFDLDIQKNKNNPTLNYPLIIGVIVALLLIGGGIYWFVTRDKDDAEENQEEMLDNGAEDATDNEQTAEKVIDSTDFNQNTEDVNNTTSQVSDTLTDTSSVDNSASNNEVDSTAATSNENETDTNTASSSTTNSDNSANVYFIVSGAFRIEENAHNKVAQLKTEGYNNAVIAGQNGSGLYIVAYEGFSNMDDAKTKLAEVRQSHPQAWIYKK